ncbi:MAG: acyclic terpene utilization AtuA family protein, partial [Vicinamibacteria bacterium]
MAKRVRIGAGQGFYGDTFFPALEIAERGDVQYIGFDALAELTLAILQKDRQKDPTLGYTKDLPIFMQYLLPIAVEKGIRLVTNAGGINPRGAVEQVIRTAQKLGLKGLRIARVEGDDVTGRIDELRAKGVSLAELESKASIETIKERILFGCAYLGAKPIADALAQGAQVVVTGRVSDPSLFLGPLIHEFGWSMEDWNRLAAGTVIGHLLECSAQPTGGNWSGPWWEIPMMERMGYPIAEVSESGEAVITKAEGTGGLVSVDTVKEQLLYEVHDPANYYSPDCVADFSSAKLENIDKDQVRLSGMRGKPAPNDLKVVIGYQNGWMGQGSIGYSWPDALAKARKAEKILRAQMDMVGYSPKEIHVDYLGVDGLHGPVAPEPKEEPNEVYLRIAVRTESRQDAERLGRFMPYLGLNGPPFIGG